MNYIDTFIEVADDSPAQIASVPAHKGGKKTIPVLQYEMIANHLKTHFKLGIFAQLKVCLYTRPTAW